MSAASTSAASSVSSTAGSSAAASPPTTIRTPILLGSSSKWRAKVLRSMGLQVEAQMNPDIDEYVVVPPGVPLADRNRSDPGALSMAVARAKSEHLLKSIPASEPARLLITSDQVAFFGGVIREKPKDPQQCREWFAQYSVTSIQVCNSVVVTNTRSRQAYTGSCVASQLFKKDIPSSVLESVIAKGDILSCCGGFMVDDEELLPYLGERIGEEDELIGLPKRLLLELLQKADDAAVAAS